MQEIMQYLKAHGELLDSEIASGTGMSLANVSRCVSALSAKGALHWGQTYCVAGPSWFCASCGVV